MYKSLKRIVLLLALVCVTLGLSAFALACNPEPEDNGPEISAEYQALYEQYKEAAGENAKTLQDWYDALSADIEEIGDIGDITDMDVLEIEDVKYVALTYENGRLFLEELLNGESFREYSVFTLSPNNAADESTITGIYLDVNRKGANGALEKVRTARTGADGKVSVYLEVDGQATYVVTIGEQSAEAYGFAPGYEPEFSGSQETKTVAFSVQAASQKVTYTAKVVYRADNYAPTKDVKLSLRYVESDAASLKVLGEGKTGDDGKLEISFYAHENSKYEFVLDESSLTPEKYDPVEGPIEVDPEADETVFTLIRLKNYGDPEILTPSGTPTKPEDPDDREVETLKMPTAGESETLFNYDAGSDTYTYINSADTANNGKQLFVAMDYFLERVHPEKTIKELLEEGGYFTYEECIDEDQNTWAKHDYSQVLEAYMSCLNKSGIYPLNKDLYSFITSAAANGLFKEKADDEVGEYDMFKPLVVWSATRLIVGREYTTTLRASDTQYYWNGYNVPRTAVPLMSDMEEGWYKLNVKSSGFEKTNDPQKQMGKNARLGGYTKDKNGLFTFGRVFTLDMKSAAGTTSNVEFEGIIYVGAGDKEIDIMCGAYDYLQTYNLTLNLSKITAEDATLGELAGKKQQLLSPDNSEYEVLVYPENSIWEQHTNAADSTERQYLANYTNIPTYGYTFDMNNQFVKYTITPTVEGIDGLKIHKYDYSYSESTQQMNSKTEPVATVSFSYTAGIAIDGETTKLDVEAYKSSAGSAAYGVLFTHSGEGVKTMKIKLEAAKTKYTVTYSAGEGEGKDYTEGSGNKFYNIYTYYAEAENVRILDNTHASLGYTREGYLFNGWSYEDAEGETKIVKPGDRVPMLDHDMVFTAVWREVNANSKDLAVGEEVEVEFDSETYTTVEINLADTVVENKGYTLTITMGAEEWNSGLQLVLGDYKIYPIAAETSETSHTYVAYFIKLGEADKIIVDLSKLSVNLTATFALEEYTPVVLKADGSEIIVPIYDRDLVKGSVLEPDKAIVNVLYAALDESMTTPSTYSFAKGNAVPAFSNVSLQGDLADDDDGGITYHDGNTFIMYNTAQVILAEGVTKIHFIKYMSSDKFFGAGKITITNLYSVTYKSTQEDVENKGASATPASDFNVYKDGASVTLQTPSDIRDAYAFDYWTIEGDTADTHYLGGSQYEIHKNTTFVAHWKQLNKMQVHVDLNKGNSGTGDENLNIDPDTNTHCEIILENIANISRGLIVTLDLGTSDFSKEIPMKIGTTNVIFTHSEARSSAGHNVYSAAYRTTNSTTVTLKLDLDAWKTAGNSAINGIKVDALMRTSVGQSGNYSAYGVLFVKKDNGKLWANGSLNENITAAGQDFGYGLPAGTPKGYSYDVHVKFHIDDPKTTIGSSITLKSATGIESTMNYDESSKEYTYKGWDSSTKDFFMLESQSIKDGLTCDVWLEQAAGGYTLSLEKTADSVKITKAAPATVYLEETVAQGANNIYVITVTGATDNIKLAFTDSSSASITANLESANSYTAKRITFGGVKLTLSTEAEAEQTVTVKLTKFDSENSKVFNAGGENVYSLGADKAVIDFDCGFLAASSTSYYKVKLTTKDGGALDESAVIKFRVIRLTGTSQEYTFNQANGFIVDVVTLPIEKMCYYELWSENGAIEIKMAFEKYSKSIKQVGNIFNGFVTYEFKNVDDSVEILIIATGNIKTDTEYCVNLLLPAANADCQFEITCGQKTITLKGDASSTTLTTTEKVTFAEDYSILKVTAKAGITASASIRIYLTAPTV